MKGLENIKKIKSPVKPKVSSKSRNNKSYEKFLRGPEKQNVSKDKKVIKVQRKRNSPKRVLKDIQDINEIERKMIQMNKVNAMNQMNKVNAMNQMKQSNNNIKVPTQNNTQKKDIPKPMIKNQPSVKRVVKQEVKEPIYNGPQINTTKKNQKKVRISEIDVREKRSDEILTEHKKVVQKPIQKPIQKPVKKVVQKPIQKPVQKPVKKKSNPKPIKRSLIRSNTRKKHSKTNRKISIRNKNLGEKDIQNVSQKMKQIRSTKTDEIKKELEKQGVKVSGKSDRLLKDIYLYSKVCNINITHEK